MITAAVSRDEKILYTPGSKNNQEKYLSKTKMTKSEQDANVSWWRENKDYQGTSASLLQIKTENPGAI